MTRARRIILTWCFPVVAGVLGLTLRLSDPYALNARTDEGVVIVEVEGQMGVNVPRVTHPLTPLASWVDDSPYQPH